MKKLNETNVLEHLLLPYSLCVIAKKKKFDEICIASWESGFKPKNIKPFLIVFENIKPIELTDEQKEFLVKRPGLLAPKEPKNSNIPIWCFAAPSYEQIKQWFKKKHNIKVRIGLDYGIKPLKQVIKDSDLEIKNAFKKI